VGGGENPGYDWVWYERVRKGTGKGGRAM
jgi:hypothetical protein